MRLDLGAGGRLRRTERRTLSDAERVRLAAEFDHERSEMFFARAVVLVEGQTERQSLPLIFRALGHDPDADRGGAARMLEAEIRRSAGEAPIIRLDPDFEAAAGLAAHTDKVLRAWRRFATVDATDVPAALTSIVRVTTQLLDTRS